MYLFPSNLVLRYFALRTRGNAGFRQMMERGRSYLHTRPQPGREPA